MTENITIIRAPHDKQRPYFSMARDTVQDARLSWEARGVLAYLLSKPSDWQVMLADLRQQCGRQKVLKIIAELRECKYVEVVSGRDTRGRFTAEYRVHERPMSEVSVPVTESVLPTRSTGIRLTDDGGPVSGKQPLHNIDTKEREQSIETKEETQNTEKEQNLAGAQNAPAGVALKADEDGVIVEETPESKDAWKNHADILKALATHVNAQLVAVIAAWKDNLLAPPVDGKNPYQNRTIRALALALLSEGYGKSHVERYVKAYYAPGSWWRDKPLSFQQVCERMPAWIAANPDPFEAQRKADEEWERYKASLSSEERAELAAQIEQDEKERG